MPSYQRPLPALFLATVLLASPVFAFDPTLSDEAVREAYFLGQRHDQTTESFLQKYVRHLPLPETGPHISHVTFLTPYANAVHLSSMNLLGTSAQDALAISKKSNKILRVFVYIDFTASYGALIETPTGSRSGAPQGYKFRSPDFWRDFSYRLFQHDQAVPPVSIEGEATYSFASEGTSSVLTGAVVTMYFDASSIDSAEEADVVVDTLNNQQTVATFDLAALR
jgi:hypothetical protein